MKRIITAIFLLFFLGRFNLAQEILPSRASSITSDPDYRSAEGESADRERAIEFADRELVAQVGGIFITQATNWIRRENITDSTEQYLSAYQQRINSFSCLYLKGLKHEVMKKDSHWWALAYIHKDSLAASFEKRKNRIRDYYFNALQRSNEGRIGQCLRNLYWGFLLTYAYPDAVLVQDAEGNAITINRETFIRLFNSIIDEVCFQQTDFYQSGDIYVAVFKCKFRNEPVKELLFSYYGGSEGSEYNPVEDGNAEIPFFDKPESLKRKVILRLEYQYQNDMSLDPEVSGLFDIFGEYKFNNEKKISAYFSPNLDSTQTETSTEVPEEKIYRIEDENIPPPFLEVMYTLAGSADYAELKDFINQYLKLNSIILKRPEDIKTCDQPAVIILNDQNLVDLLYYNGSVYISLKDRKNYNDPAQAYPEMAQIWLINK